MQNDLTVQENLEIMTLQRAFREYLGHAITDAMRRSHDGRIEISMPEIEDFILRAFLLGKGRR